MGIVYNLSQFDQLVITQAIRDEMRDIAEILCCFIVLDCLSCFSSGFVYLNCFILFAHAKIPLF